MDCLSACHCKLILNEVFECEDVDALVKKADELLIVVVSLAQRPSVRAGSLAGGEDGDEDILIGPQDECA